MAGLLNKKAKFEDVVKERDILKMHYDRFTKGDRDTLARECFHHVEMAIQNNEYWAVALRDSVYKK